MSNVSTRKRGVPNPLQWIGAAVLGFFTEIGRLTVFSARVKFAAFTPRWYVGQIWRQIINIGFYSLPVVGLSAVFIGAEADTARSNSCQTLLCLVSRGNWASRSPA